ncbi:MAG: hypothetical protein IPM42_10415 [Saprospiraceae bacterium]|nr:hypothetical protein [Saprospiraceae bacterium]
MDKFKNDKKFLFIHYHYPPIRSSGIYRNYYFSDALTKLVGRNYLITTDNRNYLSIETLPINPNISIQEVFTLDYRRTLALFQKGKGKSETHFKESTKQSFIASWLIKLQRSFPFSIFLAEGALIYIILGYFKGKKLVEKEGINVLYSSFMPYADHIIAYLLKRRYPQLIWVADFRDLQVEPIYKNTFFPDFQRKTEKYLLRKANVVTTVSEGISAKMRQLHSNVHTITKGVALREPTEYFDKFTIHYSGSLFLDFRDPRPLFKALFNLLKDDKIDKNKVCFLYAGKDGTRISQYSDECGINPIFEDKGMVSRIEALDMQNRSHINLLLTSASDEHTGLLTGKLFEYIDSGREILCLIKGSKDEEIEKMFDSYGLGSVIYDEITVTNYVLEKYEEWLNTGEVISHQEKEKIVNEMSWQCQAEKLLALIS